MSKVIAAYGGGFKPPTKGHFEVVQKALSQNPKIDEFIIYVGSGERGGLNQAQSILIWEIYQTYLPMKVKIEPSKSPIGDIIRLGKNNLQDEVYFVLGAREGFEDDMKDIESRTKNIEEKYPNMKIKIITTPNKGISGTNARKASQVSYDDFIKYIPSELSDSEKEEVYNIIKPSISETNNPKDGKAAPYGSGYNKLNENITQSQLNALESYADNLFAKLGIDIEFTRHFLDRVNDERNIKPISIPELIGMFKRLYKKHGKPLSKIDNDFDAVVKDFNSNINIPFAINVTPEDIELVAKTVMRKKDFKTSTPVIALEENDSFNLDIPKFNYKKTLSERLWDTLNEISLSKENAVEVNGDLTGGNFTVGNIIYEYSIKNISNPYEDLGLFYNMQFTPKEETTSIPQMGKENYIKILSTMYKIIVDFIEKEKPEYVGISSLDNNGKNYHKVYANLTDNKSNNISGYFRKDVNLEFTTPEGKGRFIVLKRKKNLNENASYSQDIDIKSKIMQLTQHMLDKGMNIEPLPKVEFVDGDSDNAREFLGKTAYYNPNNNTIVLYTEGRHPKDITRSFSHEMIHHIQNLEGRLGDITTTNTQEDDHLNDIEAEANLKGTMTFRNWTDSLNEGLEDVSLDYIKTKHPKLNSYPKSDIILSKGDFIYINIPQDKDFGMTAEIKAFDKKDGTLVAQSSFDYDKNGKLKGTLDVRPDKRRLGIATEIYKLSEKIIGDTIFPEEKHTEDAKKFWQQKNRSFGPKTDDNLNENLTKNSNYVYHWTSYSACKKIIESNKLKSNKSSQFFEYDKSRDLPDYKNVVFFTVEDERFADEETSNQCILVVDKSKLSKDYKVISYGDPYEETIVYTNDSSIPILPYLKGVMLMNTLQKSAVKKMTEFLESKDIPYEINDNLEREVKAKKAKLPGLKKALINKLKLKYPNGFIGYLNSPLYPSQTLEYFKNNPTYSYPSITINKPGEYGEKNKFQLQFEIKPQNLEKYINWFQYNPDSIEDLTNMDNYEGEELWLKGDIPVDINSLQEANLKSTMTSRNWTDSLNENISTQSFPNSAFLFGGFFTGMQGMGIGKAVIQDLFKNNPKIENLLLYTQDDAIGFWKKLGGKVIQQGEDKKGTLRYFVQINKNDVDTNSNMKQLGISYKNLSTKKSKIDKGEYIIKMGRQKIGFFFVRDVGTIEMNPMNIIINNLNEYGNSGPSTPKVYIVKDDGTYKEAPIGLLSKISNLTYDMGGGETNYYPEKNIVIVDNIPVEEFIKRSNYSKIKDEKIYVEYNLNQPYSFPKANEIIAAQIVYHLDNREAFAQTIANSLKDGGTFEFFSDLMNKKDKVFLQHLSDEYGFGLPTKLNQYKSEPLPLKKEEFIEPVISYIYKITDKDGKTATLSTTKKGNSWEWKKIDGDIDFKTGKWSVPPESPDPDFRAKKYTLRSFDTYLSVLGDSNTIVDFEKLNEANKPYKHKHGFDDKLGKDPFGLNQFAREVAEGVLNEGRYDRLTNQLSRAAFKVFKDAHDRGDEKDEFKFIVDHPDEEHDIPSKDFFFDFEGYVEFTDDLYFVDGGADVGLDNVGDEIQPILNVSFKIPKNPDWQKVSFDIKDVVRHELEHLTQGGGNLKSGKYIEDDQLVRDLVNAKMLPKSQYFKLEGEVDAMLQGMYFKAKKSRQPFGKIINNYLDIFVDGGEITSEEKEDILKVWRSRGKALSLPLFEQTEEQMNYTIYSDMDGVLTDFDIQFMKASEGIIPSEYKRNFGTNGFWDLIEKGGVGYWAGMPWMSDGKKYWDYIKKYNPLLLSSPSASEPSRLGKRVWVKNNLPGTKLILARSTDKQKYADENSILIDDRPSNIDQWRSQGGIGILHVSAEDTIQQLKKLGL